MFRDNYFPDKCIDLNRCVFFFCFLSQFHFDNKENTTAILILSFVQPTSFASHKDTINNPFLFTCGEVFLNNNNNNNDNNHVKSIVFKFFHPLHYTFPIYQINSHCFFYREHAVTQLVGALRYKPEGRGFDSH